MNALATEKLILSENGIKINKFISNFHLKDSLTPTLVFMTFCSDLFALNFKESESETPLFAVNFLKFLSSKKRNFVKSKESKLLDYLLELKGTEYQLFKSKHDYNNRCGCCF